MANIYFIKDDGTTEPMTRVRCQSEDRELQALLERNLDLIPGEQIDPEDPRRWLLIKREMPVPDPGTGADRWSIDFFLVDQDAIPTFVECKRFADTRSRREIVGQMFEYAANGHYYWTTDLIRGFAEEVASRKGLQLDDSIRALHPTNDESTDDFFLRVQDNLREGQIRIVFFLEESPMELKSVVDFLNKQMERSEVLLVEARQYDKDGKRIVVPTLFGYTEEARQVKRSITITSAASRKKWDKSSFFTDARSRLSESEVQVLQSFYDQCISIGYDIGWGTGASKGSFSIKDQSVCPRSFLTISSNGNLSLNFGWINGSDIAERSRNRFKEMVEERTALRIPDDFAKKWPAFSISEWGDESSALVGVIRDLLTELQRADA